MCLPFCNLATSPQHMKIGFTLAVRGHKGVLMKRDGLLLFAVTCDCKNLKAENCE